MNEGSTLPSELTGPTDEAMRSAFGAGAGCVSSRVLRMGRSVVARLEVTGAPVGSAIAKIGPDADLLWNEWAGLEFLTSLPDPIPVPTFYAAARFERQAARAEFGEDMFPDVDRLALVVMEDLGEHPSLADLLLSDRAGASTAAAAALDGYVDALAAVHLATFGRGAEHAALRAARGEDSDGPAPLEEVIWPRLVETIAEFGIGPVPAKADDAVRWIDRTLRPEGRWHAFTVADCCPDNNQVRPDGVRLLDLEFSGFRHALADVAYLHTTMPTCWCVRRFPDRLADRLVDRYRARLKAADVPAAMVCGPGFDAGLAAARALFALWSVELQLRAGLRDPDAAEQRRLGDFPMPSRHQATLFRLEQLADVADETTELTSLGELATRLLTDLTARWPATTALPLYPAFTPTSGVNT